MAKTQKITAIEYSPKQRAAVEAEGKNVCVSSGAGSGKTSVLVGRFLYLVTEKKIAPDAIVAITYTEKAANHMKEKLVRAFLERGRLEERRLLEGAYIGTIHSFAARLLKENPIEAGVDPRFTVIEEGQAGLLMEEVLEELLEEAAGEPEGFELLERYEEEGIRKGLRKIYSKIRSFGATFDERIARELSAEDAFWDKLEAALRNFLEAKGQKESAAYRENLEAAHELLGRTGKLKQDTSWEPPAALAAFSKRFKKIGALKETVSEIKNSLEALTLLKTEKAGERVRRNFSDLYKKFEARYEARKNQAAFLDFEDLLAKASLLFSCGDERNAAVRDRYRRKFSHILVDEFQDTSRLQAKWIDGLARQGGFFIIGDPKQSIYRFRNADLESFLEREKAMKDDPEALQISLGENYRSRGEILGFVNHLFKELWREDGFEFEPLVPERRFAEKKGPSVEFLCVEQAGEEEEESKAQARVREAKTLASRIREMVESGEIKITERDGTVRDVAYGDIAILFRAMTNSNLYENELREQGIPYFVVRGRGFYEKQEIADLVNFLSILDNPKKDIELAAVLRSPLVGISEDGLFWLSRVKTGAASPSPGISGDDEEKASRTKGAPFSEAFRREDLIGKLSEEDRLRLRRFLVFYSELRRGKDRLGISEILERLLSETAYDTKLLGTRTGKQKTVNVWKLVEIARQFETNRAFTLRDFVAYVTDLRSQDPRESEAQVELERGDSVKLLTIHKAKGLEFPVVVLADLGREKGSFESEKFNFSETFGVGFKFRNEVTQKWQEGFLFNRNKEWEKQRDREEQKRLFYVAMTRAEEHLILSGVNEMEDIKEGRSYHELSDWMKWLRKAFRYEGSGGRRNFEFSGTPITLLSPAEELPIKKKIPARIEKPPFRQAYETLAAIEEKEAEAPSAFSGETAERIAGGAASFRKDYYETRDLPVTAMLVFEECPGCYFDRYEMRAPEQAAEYGEEEGLPEEEGPVLAGRDFGDFFHRVMENFDFSKSHEEELSRHLFECKKVLGETDLKKLESGIRGFLSSEFGKAMRAFEIYKELPFLYKLPRGKLSGKIDLLAKTREGKWILLDYKTDRIQNGEELERRRRHHEAQIVLYALALKDVAGILPAEGILYFASAGRQLSFSLNEGKIREAKERVSENLEKIVLRKEPFLHRKDCPRGSLVFGKAGAEG